MTFFNIFSLFLQIFIEFCDGGALDTIIVDLEKGLTEKQIAYVCRGMCQGLVHLHKQGIIHRDLKAGNVLLTCQVCTLTHLIDGKDLINRKGIRNG